MVKIPRFAFEKFPGADPELTTTMKSVGEAMSLGRNFTEALGKAMRSLETKAAGFWTAPDPAGATAGGTLRRAAVPHDGRLYTVERALRLGATVAEVAEASGGIDPWFVDQIAALVELRAEIVDAPCWTSRCCAGPSGPACPTGSSPRCARSSPARTGCGRCATGSACARSTRPSTPAPPSSPPPRRTTTPATSEETEVAPSDRPKVLILGSGPNRIGQGIEFDYSCVHAVHGAARRPAYETVMVNCNPETVSTDYDTADRLYFEPLTFEDVLEVFHAEDSSGGRPAGPASSA